MKKITYLLHTGIVMTLDYYMFWQLGPASSLKSALWESTSKSNKGNENDFPPIQICLNDQNKDFLNTEELVFVCPSYLLECPVQQLVSV